MSEKNQVGFESIATERIEQVQKHKFDLNKDRKFYKNGQLLVAARFCETLKKEDWPKGWGLYFRKKIEQKSLIERLVVKGAFIAAEIDRLNGIESWQFELESEKYTEWARLSDYVRKKEDSLGVHRSGSLIDKISSLINHFSYTTSIALANKKDCIEKMKIYMQAMKMLAEGVGMASTHGEKASRLRGMIEVMNSTIEKLNNDHQDEILSNWMYAMNDRSDFPYREILSKYQQTKNENEALKNKIDELTKAQNA